MTNFELFLSVHSNCIRSIVSIYTDTEHIRRQRTAELEDRLKIKTWTQEEFNTYSHYRYHFDWLLMQSLFMSGFSYFENYFRDVAHEIEKTKNNKIKTKDIKGHGYLDTYRKYTCINPLIDWTRI